MKFSKSLILKGAALICFYVAINRLAHGKTMSDGIAITMGCIALAAGITLAIIAFRLDRNPG